MNYMQSLQAMLDSIELNIDEYQDWTKSCVAYPPEAELNYTKDGLVSEAGEVAGVYAKFWRGDFGKEELDRRLQKELGDVFWMLVRLCDTHGWKASTIIKQNIIKLEQRKINNTVKGDGDNR